MNTLHQRRAEVNYASSPGSTFQELAERAMSKDIRKGEYVFRVHERPDHIFYLFEGRMKIGTHSANGREVMKGVIYPEEIFGESALVDVGPRHDFAQAIQHARFAIIPLEIVRRRMREDPAFTLELSHFLGQKLMRTEQRLKSVLFMDAKARIVDFLKEVAQQRGEMDGYEVLVRNFALTHQDVANLTGTSRQTVTMVLNELKDANLIYIDRRNLLIRDMEKL